MLHQKTAVIILVAISCCLVLSPALAQDSGDLVGVIPGTDMLRDEFRARAIIQMKAIMLCAMTYRVLHNGDYPENLYVLKDSEAWNLDVKNMFSGMPIQSIYYETDEDSFTSRPLLDIPLTVEGAMPSTELFTFEDGQMSINDGASFDTILEPGSSRRVDPAKLSYFTGGDVMYYTDGGLLQLVIFALDGTYMEYVDETPNLRWQAILQVLPGAPWPDSIKAAAVLFFVDSLLLQHYNLVEFMGSRETILENRFAEITATERISLAASLGIDILNPTTQQPIIASAEPSTGDFTTQMVVPTPTSQFSFMMWLRDGSAWSIDSMHAAGGTGTAASGDGSTQEKPERRPPLMGGRK